MTLILCIGCKDGIVIGSESASTDGGYKLPSPKLGQVSALPILYGGSGDVGLMQKITCEFPTEIKALPPSIKALRKKLCQIIKPELDEAIRTHVRNPLPGLQLPPIAWFLFAIILDKKPYILEVEKDGRDTLYDAKLGDFYAIGSGKELAQAVMRPHIRTERTLETGKIMAHRVLEDAIDMAAGGLARPIQLQTMDLSGNVVTVPEPEKRALAETCELWREMERECLGRLLAPKSDQAAVPVPVPQPPTPDAPSAPAAAIHAI